MLDKSTQGGGMWGDVRNVGGCAECGGMCGMWGNVRNVGECAECGGMRQFPIAGL